MKHLLPNRKMIPLSKAPNALELYCTMKACNLKHLGNPELPSAGSSSLILSYSEKKGVPDTMKGLPARKQQSRFSISGFLSVGRRMFDDNTDNDVGNDGDNLMIAFTNNTNETYKCLRDAGILGWSVLKLSSLRNPNTCDKKMPENF